MKDATQIVIVLDRSGSMEVVREATVESFNQFMIKQKALPGEASVYFVQFNTEYQVLFDKPLSEAPTLSYLTYQPNGGTALYDAVGHTIDTLGQRLRDTPEYLRPNKVIFLILTDGQENSSRRYSQPMIADRIEHQRGKYGWDFIFLGANQDAILTARALNIPIPTAMTFRASPQQVGISMEAASRLFGAARMGEEACFSVGERAAAVEDSSPSESNTNDKQGSGLLASVVSRIRRKEKGADSPSRS